MDIEFIFAEWAKDGEIDQTNYTKSITEIPKLHNKYIRMYIEERLKLIKLKAEFKVLTKLKGEWYRGELDAEEIKQRGWNPQPLKILRVDIPSYIESDPDIIKHSLKIGLQEEMVGYLDSIVKQIANRNFLFKSIIDWERFRSGA